MLDRTFDKINLKFLQKSYETDTLTNVIPVRVLYWNIAFRICEYNLTRAKSLLLKITTWNVPVFESLSFPMYLWNNVTSFP